MNARTKDCVSPVQKVMDLGIIDSWLRGVAGLAPQGVDPDNSVMQEFNLHTGPVMDRKAGRLDLNTHMLQFTSHATITQNDIRKMTGFRRLLQACTRNDVRIDITDDGRGRLEARFTPDEPFLQSRIFGSMYITSLPDFFRERMLNG